MSGTQYGSWYLTHVKQPWCNTDVTIFKHVRLFHSKLPIVWVLIKGGNYLKKYGNSCIDILDATQMHVCVITCFNNKSMATHSQRRFPCTCCKISMYSITTLWQVVWPRHGWMAAMSGPASSHARLVLSSAWFCDAVGKSYLSLNQLILPPILNRWKALIRLSSCPHNVCIY